MITHKLSKYFLLIVFVVGTGTACRAEGNLPWVDEKLIHFGFLLGINAMDFRVTPKDIENTARISFLKPGFTVGIISDLRLNRYLNLRFTPTLHFGERELNYSFKFGPDSIHSVDISSIPICLPIYLKYSAERTGNYRPYLIWGAGISFDLATNSDDPVTLKPLDVYTEFGVGCDIYFSFFKLAPELKYSIGFNDIFAPAPPLVPNIPIIPVTEKQKFSNVLSHLTSRMLTLSFNFE